MIAVSMNKHKIEENPKNTSAARRKIKDTNVDCTETCGMKVNKYIDTYEWETMHNPVWGMV